jgi:hypothetical protein
MGVVFSSLWHWMFPGKEYKIVMVSEDEKRKKKKNSTTGNHRCMCCHPVAFSLF